MSSDETCRTTNKIGGALMRGLSILVMALLVAMMLLTVADVFLRYVFNSPIFGGTEITEGIMLATAFSGMILCTILKGHIKVELIGKFFKPAARLITGAIFYLLGAGLFSLTLFLTIPMALEQKSIGAATSLLDIPLYPLYLLIAISFGILTIILLVFVVQNILRLVKK